MKNSYLKAAMILGTILIVWSVICLNIFGIIGSIFSWVAYSRQIKKAAFTAMGFYIAALALCFGASAELLFVLAPGSTMEQLFVAAAIFNSIGIIPIVICALFSYKGGKELAKNGSGSDGFFE